MFGVGEFIIYGSNGVCEIVSVGPVEGTGTVKDRIYYTLKPVNSRGSTIFTPADNEKVFMRPLVSKEEALRLIDGAGESEELWISDEKKREMIYKEAIAKCDCDELVKMIKTIYLRMQGRIKEGKKITNSDEKYFHLAEERLYSELAVALGIKSDEVKELFIEKVN